VDPKQPLAPHQALVDAAGLHSDDMLRRNYFAHESPEGLSPTDRAKNAGYPRGAGENIAWSGNTIPINQNEEVYQRHYGLVESVGHRVNMMTDHWREIGAGVRYGTYTDNFRHYNSIMVGTLFGTAGGVNFITGVAINDLVARNNFYDIGEGLGSVTVTATQNGTGDVFTDTTGTSGGYGIQVPNGTYSVTASGGRLGRTITINGVYVDGKNVKLDFNSANTITRDIRGTVFVDANGNGAQNSSDFGSADQQVFLDMDADGVVDNTEPKATTDANGGYRFEALVPGDYTVALVVPSGWTQTSPVESYEVTITQPPNQHLVNADFGIQTINEPPIARDESFDARAGKDVSLNVTGNDFDNDGSLETSSVRVVTQPSHGDVSVNPTTGEVIYTADLQYVGLDVFTYQVADNQGDFSNEATVETNVTSAFPWQNPALPLDVNNDGHIVPQDVLIIITEINLNGSVSLDARVRADRSPYLDVNGDGFLTPVDALRVIQHLNRISVTGGGEPPEPTRATALSRSASIDLLFASQQSDEDDEFSPFPTPR